jgi:hypothetical protein
LNIKGNLIKDRLEFRQLLQKYHLMDLIGDSSESIGWFRQIMLELAGWVDDKERAREIFREEWNRQREEQERFERAVATGFPNPYSEKRFRRFRI